MYTVQIKATGPLFSGLVRYQLTAAMQGAVQELVELGEQRLDQFLRPRPAGVYLAVTPAHTKWPGPGHSRPGRGSTGYYASRIHGEVKFLHGIINDGNVIYGRWLEGVSSRNQSTRFKGYRSFQRTATWLNRNKRKVLEAHVKKFVSQVN